jgi:hypothetical protein
MIMGQGSPGGEPVRSACSRAVKPLSRSTPTVDLIEGGGEIYRRGRPLRSFLMSAPPVPDLTGVHAKLDRAEEHMDALRDEIRPLMEGLSSVQGETRHNVLDDSYSVIMRGSAALPVVRWGVLLGDVCHNMRSALDHLVAALVPAGQVQRHHQFPILRTALDWSNEMNKRKNMLDHVDPTHVAIIESAQPYMPNTGLPGLTVLQRFSNNDKHRLIHAAVTSLTDQPEITVQWAIPTTVLSVDYRPGKPIRDGDELARYKPNVYTGIRIRPDGLVEITDAEMRTNAGFKCTTVFGEPGNEDTRLGDFRETLKDIRQLVNRF